MEDIVELLRSGVMDTGVLISSAAEINAIMEMGAYEIESLRAQLAEVTRERDKQQELSDWYQDHSNILARVGQERDKLKQQLLATQAKLAQRGTSSSN